MLNSKRMAEWEGEPGQPILWALEQSALFFETPIELFARVFRELRPRTPTPAIYVHFRQFANADSMIRLEDGELTIRISDVLEGAPAPVLEALAFILLGKLYRKPIAKTYTYRYRLFLNRRDIRKQLQLIKQVRGRKFVSGPQGEHRDLAALFEKLNQKHFDGLLGQPQLGWSRRPSRGLLGHFDPSHNAIIISRIFDDPAVPVLALEYVMFHEMLHLQFPVDHSGARRRVHTKAFRAEEKTFPQFSEAKVLLKKL